MLAAVRELRQAHWEYEQSSMEWAENHDTEYSKSSAYEFLLHVVSSHELRAGGKGE